jgi:hypothetical protein
MKSHGIDHIHHTLISINELCLFMRPMNYMFFIPKNKNIDNYDGRWKIEKIINLYKTDIKIIINSIKNTAKYSNNIELLESDNGTQFLLLKR